MAATSTTHTWTTLARRALAATAVAAAATVALAVPASAHTPEVEAKCKDEKTVLRVKLENYQVKDGDDKPNSVRIVEVTDDGEQLVDEADFGRSFRESYEDFDPTEPHKFVVVVEAFDDPEGKEGWSKEFTEEVEACKEKPEEPSAPEEPPTSTETEEAPPTTTITTTTEVPIGANGQLAETGASIALPAVIGGLLLVGGGAMLFLIRRRSKA
jgi:LPXTG-motif cell wall-anchored protein